MAALFSALTVVTAPGGGWPTPVNACSTPSPPIDYFVREADADALVKTVAIGGPDNRAPTQTPDPRILQPRANGGTPIISLEGIGATLQVEEVLTGSLPSQV